LGNLEEDIEWAKGYFEANRGLLTKDIRLAGLLERYTRACEKSASLRSEAGVLESCRSCEEKEGGSCCGAGIEERYDRAMLVINLLLGASLPLERTLAGSCFFLGGSGCLLKARDVLCVNYMCRKIHETCPRDLLLALQEAEGVELDLLFGIHDHVSRRIREGLL
jgi:hypothetical protein